MILRVILFLILTYSVQEILMATNETSGQPKNKTSNEPENKNPCPMRICDDYQGPPMCAKKKEGLCYKIRVFENKCKMDAENDCNEHKYEPCVKKRCNDGKYRKKEFDD